MITDTPLGLAYDQLGAFAAVSEAQLAHMVTWAAATRIFRQFPAFARLDLSADGKGCGKTVSMEATLALCPESVTVAYSTTPALKGWFDEHPDSVVGLDERDGMFGVTGRATGGRGELMAVLNAGYAANGQVMCMRSGKAAMMPVYNAMATAGIGRAPETLLDRSLTIRLRKAQPAETWVSVLYERELARTGQEIGEWLDSPACRKILAEAPRMLDIDRANPRRNLIMAPCAAVALAAGCLGEWLEADEAIQSGIASSPLPSRSHILLADLAAAGVTGRVSADDIREALPGQFAPGRFGDLTIAGLLRDAGIVSTAGHGARGYSLPER